jgi:GNAT superfamily N-acetyltransferase
MGNLRQLNAIDTGIRLWWHTIAKARGQSLHGNGLYEWVLSGNRCGPERIFNVRIPADSAYEEADRLLEGMKSDALPGGMLLTPLSTPGNIAGILARKGFKIDDSCPCMALELNDFAALTYPEEINVSAIGNENTLRDWERIVNDGLFGCELFSHEQYSDFYSLRNTELTIALYDGLPASACMTIWEGEDATLECVATLKEYRHKGLGRAVVSKALLNLKSKGVKTVTLRSEPDGINLYRKLGFTDVCNRIVASI